MKLIKTNTSKKQIKSNQTDFILIKQKLFETLSEFDKENLIENINPKNVFNLVTIIMSLVDTTKLSGLDKKQLTLTLIQDIIQHSNINEENKSYILDIVTNVFDPFVENIIDVSKGNFKINISKIKSIVNFLLKCINKKTVI